jgi:hypothetical protein
VLEKVLSKDALKGCVNILPPFAGMIRIRFNGYDLSPSDVT